MNRAATWSHRRTIKLYLDRQDAADNKTDYTVGERINPADVLEVPAFALDEYVDQVGVTRVDVCKLDIEGAELFALQGMANILNRH